MQLPKLSFSVLPKGRLGRGLAMALVFTALAAAPALLTSPDRVGSAIDAVLPGLPGTPPAGVPGAMPQAAGPQTSGLYAMSQIDAARANWSWTQAKDLAASVWEDQLPGAGSYSSFYCGCTIERRGSTGGDVDLASCGYEPRRSLIRAERLEWEHIVPAAAIGAERQCWKQGAPQCVDARGASYAGRECCERVDPDYNIAATDPVNLAPAIGEVNADRSNFAFAELLPASSLSRGGYGPYGQCAMRIDPDSHRVEPPRNRRGDIARITAYMSQAYGIPVSRDQAETLMRWMAEDPVSAEEIAINRAIAARGHRPNHLVLPRQ